MADTHTQTHTHGKSGFKTENIYINDIFIECGVVTTMVRLHAIIRTVLSYFEVLNTHMLRRAKKAHA